MKRLILALTATGLMPLTAMADLHEGCEIVVVNEVVDADGGRMTVASYRPATEFIKTARKDPASVKLSDQGSPIRGVICVRNDLVPQESDFPVLATGVPLSLSQDFDSADSDILTIYFDQERFNYRYTSDYPMSGEFAETLDIRLDDFTSRDHKLVKTTQINN